MGEKKRYVCTVCDDDHPCTLTVEVQDKAMITEDCYYCPFKGDHVQWREDDEN